MDVVIREIQTGDYPEVLFLLNNELGNTSVNAENISVLFESMSNKST